MKHALYQSRFRDGLKLESLMRERGLEYCAHTGGRRLESDLAVTTSDTILAQILNKNAVPSLCNNKISWSIQCICPIEGRLFFCLFCSLVWNWVGCRKLSACAHPKDRIDPQGDSRGHFGPRFNWISSVRSIR